MKHVSATLVIVSVVLFQAFSFAQTPDTSLPNQTTNGNCSPIFNASGNTNTCNIVPTVRRLDEKEKSDLSTCLAKHPGTVTIGAVIDNSEAYDFASDWLEVFHRAKWSIVDGVVHQGWIGGQLWTGARFEFYGYKNADGNGVTYDPTGETLANCVKNKTFSVKSAGVGALVPSPHYSPHLLNLMVGPLPPS